MTGGRATSFLSYDLRQHRDKSDVVVNQQASELVSIWHELPGEQTDVPYDIQRIMQHRVRPNQQKTGRDTTDCINSYATASTALINADNALK